MEFCEHSIQGQDVNLPRGHGNSLGPTWDVVPSAQDAPHPVAAFRIVPSKITQSVGEADSKLLMRSSSRYSVAMEREPITLDDFACNSCGDAGCGMCRLPQMCQWSTGHLPHELAATGAQTPSNENQDFDLAELLGNASGSAQSCEAGDLCSICLESTSLTPMLLACGHEFCHPCLARHVELSLRDSLVPWCPLCRCKLQSVEVSVLCQHDVDILDPAHDFLETQAPPQSSWKRFKQQRAFKRTARKLHLKLCPGCGAMIQKEDGCNHMKCRCGKDFSWDEAESVVPCSKVHWNGWRVGKTCKNCTCSAHMKLAALRTGAALGAAPVAAVGAVAAVSGVAIVVAGAAVVMAVPAVVCTPLAIAYEPVRRLRRKETNVFAKGIGAGGSAVAMGLFIGAWAVCGDGSD